MDRKHTETPWELVDGTDHHGPYIEDSAARTICDLYFVNPMTYEPVSHENAAANAAFIVRAANSHEQLIEALRGCERALHVHHFMPRGHETPKDRDTCNVCGHNFRHEWHVRLDEGHPSDVKAEAARRARAALSLTKEKDDG